MWMGVYGMMDLGASPGQMSIIPDGTAAGGEVITQTFRAIDVGMLTLLAFLICSEHLFLMQAFPWSIKLIYTLVDLLVVEGCVSTAKLSVSFLHVLN